MSWVDLGQHKNKSDHYHSFKTGFESSFEARPGSRTGLIVEPSQRKDENDCCHRF
jgi:hypothetical protein